MILCQLPGAASPTPDSMDEGFPCVMPCLANVRHCAENDQIEAVGGEAFGRRLVTVPALLSMAGSH